MSNNMNLVGRRVLLVDDSSTIRRCVEIFLGEAGCEVMLADDGFVRSPSFQNLILTLFLLMY